MVVWNKLPLTAVPRIDSKPYNTRFQPSLPSHRSHNSMSQKVLAQDLKPGMFIADLDRPWIDTPFLLQGFLLEDDDQLAQVRKYCQWVMVDPQRSAGDHFGAPAKRAAVPPREVDTSPRVVVNRAATPQPGASGPATISTKAAPMQPAGGSRPAQDGKTSAPGISPQSRGIAQPGNVNRAKAVPVSGNQPPAKRAGSEDGPTRSFWGKLREGVSGVFSKAEHEEYNDTIDDAAPETPAVPVRPAFIPESVRLTIYEDKLSVEEEVEAATNAFQRTNDLMDKVAADIRAGDTLQLAAVEEVINDVVDSMVRNPDALMWVARLREKDLNIYGHGLSVAISLVAFGRHLGYPRDQLAQLGVLGLLLDIGKIKLPRELLEKTVRLSSEEFETIKEHVELGLEILHETPTIHPDVFAGIAQHHERMNGTGYPDNIMGEKIGVFGRMAAIADTYAAVTARRPYAAAVSPHEALQMLSNWSGTQFQADMVEQFIQSIGVFPVGSLVELSTGEVAVIVTHNKQKRLRPKVLVVTAADKTPNKHPTLFDLLYDVSETPAYIRRGLPANAFGLDPSEFYLS